MNAETFATWLRRQGHKVYRTESSYWYSAGPRTLQAFPCHWVIDPGRDELRSLLWGKGMAALRYSSPVDRPTGKVSYHMVLDGCYKLENLNKKARNGIRNGLKSFSIKKISFDRLAFEGWDLQEDTLRRQNRLDSMAKDRWRKMCLCARGLKGLEVFGALCEGKLAAAAIVCRIDDRFCVPYAMSHSDHLRKHVNNALFYSMSCELLHRENTAGIFFSVESLDAPAHVDEFKLRMGFEPRPVRQHVVMHPLIRPLMRPVFHHRLSKMVKKHPFNITLSKAEGMMRFFLEGRLPARDQHIADCLLKRPGMIPSSHPV